MKCHTDFQNTSRLHGNRIQCIPAALIENIRDIFKQLRTKVCSPDRRLTFLSFSDELKQCYFRLIPEDVSAIQQFILTHLFEDGALHIYKLFQNCCTTCIKSDPICNCKVFYNPLAAIYDKLLKTEITGILKQTSNTIIV